MLHPLSVVPMLQARQNRVDGPAGCKPQEDDAADHIDLDNADAVRNAKLKRQRDFGNKEPDNKRHQVGIVSWLTVAQGHSSLFAAVSQAGSGSQWALRTVPDRARCAMLRQHQVAR